MRGRKLLWSCTVDWAATYFGRLLLSVCWWLWCRQGSYYCGKYGDLTWFTEVLFFKPPHPTPTISILYISVPTVPLWLTTAEIRQPIRSLVSLSPCARRCLFPMPKSTSLVWVLDAAVWMVVLPPRSPVHSRFSLSFLWSTSLSISPSFPSPTVFFQGQFGSSILPYSRDFPLLVAHLLFFLLSVLLFFCITPSLTKWNRHYCSHASRLL